MLALAPKGYVSTLGLASSLVICAKPGIVAACAGQIDSTAPTGTYYVQLIDAPAAVDSGGAITPIAIVAVAHTSGTTDSWSLADSLPIGGVAVNTGAVVQLSSTRTVGTLAGSYLNAAAAR